MRRTSFVLWLLLGAVPVVVVGLVSAVAVAQDVTYQVGEVVEIEENGTWYSGSILEDAGGGQYKIHYDGYSTSYDTVVVNARLRHIGEEAPAAAAAAAAAPVAAPAPGPRKGSSSYTQSAAITTGPATNTDPVSQAALAIPVLDPANPDIAWHIGDPIEVIEYGKWYSGVIRDLEYDARPFTVSMELYTEWRWWPFAEIRPTPGYTYAKLPAAVTRGEDGHWKEGDQVEVEVVQWSQFYWMPGVVVSVDGDNYYVRIPSGTSTTGQYTVWRRSDRVRNPGSDKAGWEANQPDPQGLYAAYQAEASRCPDVGDWPFLWYYDHTFDRHVYGVSVSYMTAEKVKGILDGYACLSAARAKHPGLPLTQGPSDIAEYRYDVQEKFLADYERIIEQAVRKDIAAQIEPIIVAETALSGDWVPYGVTKVNGYEEVKAEIVEEGKKYEAMATTVGMTLEYPWDQIKARYDQSVIDFDGYFHKFSPSLASVQGYTSPFTTDDPAIEAMATKEVLKAYPGSTVLSGASNGGLEIIKDDFDRPVYRYKYVATLVKNPAYRSCFKVVQRYKEDYTGGGYGSGSISAPDGAPSILAEYCPCP